MIQRDSSDETDLPPPPLPKKMRNKKSTTTGKKTREDKGCKSTDGHDAITSMRKTRGDAEQQEIIKRIEKTRTRKTKRIGIRKQMEWIYIDEDAQPF